jgi:hypothetical protein
MSLVEIAQNISPLGRVAAVVGLVLSVVVLVIRFREHNLEQASRREREMLERMSAKNTSATTVPQEEPQALFKTYTPE